MRALFESRSNILRGEVKVVAASWRAVAIPCGPLEQAAVRRLRVRVQQGYDWEVSHTKPGARQNFDRVTPSFTHE